MKFDRHIGSTAAEVPVKFQSDRTILNANLAASRLYEILRKDVFSDIETGPRLLLPTTAGFWPRTKNRCWWMSSVTRPTRYESHAQLVIHLLHLLWHERHGVSNHQQLDCLFSSLQILTTRIGSKLQIAVPLYLESTAVFLLKSARNVESVSMSTLWPLNHIVWTGLYHQQLLTWCPPNTSMKHRWEVSVFRHNNRCET